MMPILVKGDDVRSETKAAQAGFSISFEIAISAN